MYAYRAQGSSFASVGETTAQQLTWSSTGCFTVIQQHLTIHHGGLKSGRGLAESASASRKVIDKFGHVGRHRLEIEDVDIGRHAGSDRHLGQGNPRPLLAPGSYDAPLARS